MAQEAAGSNPVTHPIFKDGLLWRAKATGGHLITTRPQWKTTPSIVSRTALSQIRQRLRQEGKKVVFTNGCFDLMHRGHVEYLREARRLGDVLIVGLNSDASVRALKGLDRPFLPQEDRAIMLAELRSVSYVCLFDEPSVEALVAELLPDILTKGGDYRPEEIVGREIVERAGGQVRSLTLLPQCSTSTLIDKIKELQE